VTVTWSEQPELISPSALTTLWCTWPAVLLCIGVLAPFLNKAFTNDDVTFLLQARHVLTDPLHPTAFDMVLHGTRVRLIFAGPVDEIMAYLLVPSVALGGAEWAAHTVQLGLLVLAITATAALGLRLGMDRHQARLASLVLVASPAVLGMAATAMPDIAAMALGAAGMERLAAYWQSRRRATGIVSGVLLALAVLCRTHLVLLIAIASCWSLAGDPTTQTQPYDVGRRTGERLLPMLWAGLLVVILVYLTRDPWSGSTVTGAVARRSALAPIVFNLASFTLHWAVAFPLVALWIIVRRTRLLAPRQTPIAFGVGILLAGLAGNLSRDDWWWGVPVVLLTGLSAAVLCDIMADAIQRKDRVQAMLILWMLTGASAAVYVQLPPKLLVPAAPAMAILTVRRSGIGGGVPLGERSLAGVLGIALALGVLINKADAAQAEIGREGGRLVQQELRLGQRVWMDGAWGFQWYAMSAGARPLADSPPYPAKGDMIVAGLRARLVNSMQATKKLLYRRVFDAPGGRVQSEGAGFFNNHLGPWPWTWGRGEIGRLEVWRLDSSLQVGR